MFFLRDRDVHRNLPFKISADEMYDIFGKYGAIRQVKALERSRDDVCAG